MVNSLPIRLPDGDGKVVIHVSTLSDWLWLARVRALELPLPEHQRLQEAWIRSLHVPSERDLDVAKALSVVLARNGSTQRRWLGIDGVSDLGKTELIVNLGLRISKFKNGNADYGNQRHRHLPVIYVEATTKHNGQALLRGMCQFAGIPDGGTDEDLTKRLRQELPRLGTMVVFVDDAHMLSRSRRTATTLSNNLRAMLRLPVTFVYIGAGLEASALLQGGTGHEYASVHQLRARAERLDLRPLTLPRDKAAYDDMVRKFAGKVTNGIPSMKFSGLREPKVRAALHAQTGGRQASIFCILKDAAVLALAHESRDVTAPLLEQLMPQQVGEPHTIDPDEWPDEMAAHLVG